ncbi:glycoside hydrolase family 39 [Caldicellulosiruptor kronotskyensis 2002]|uniref:Glycoside hydrolase family 39 n=1 Tax=Caldicellulosiruptor kronotskyensis (strain DSM 18902 / VKM B-2412 / 2002) TaxID=632348 RepID=E4SEI1_CALK2|nr:beta-xylosidase [Caldicellulosiruptor kronotskyensis]ADQ45468.1 glycoside hydrolase family 39 [Caldicellulosiruptor kronotskyensis 2002]
MEITIFLQQKLGKVNKFWTKCVGSCHAATALREDWRNQLRKCRQEIGFEYVRFHGWLNDDMSVCFRNDEGKLWFSFFNIDSIIDFLLDIGMKPFIELSFMPEALASGTKTVFHYKGNITPPKSYEEWGQLVEELARHLVKRYGKNEVREWFFEVWNEPNLKDFFWAGTMEEYFELYKHAAFAIKKVDSELKVGGPASAIDAWIPELKDFCAKNGVPIDFISTHQYPTDLAFSTSSNMEEAMAKAKRGELADRVKKALSEASPLPVYYTEWNNSPSPRDPYHDIPYDAAFIVKTIIDIVDLPLGCYSYWTFTDIFEECGQSSLPFHGGFGLLNIHGIPKPSYRAFQILNKLSGERIEIKTKDESETIDCIATSNDEEIVLIVSNHNVPLSPIKTENIKVVVEGLKNCNTVILERIDEYNANPKRKWVEMGSPGYLTKEQIEELIKVSEIKKEQISCEKISEKAVKFEFDILPHSVVAITINY